jgi:hypothetical protein
VQSLVVIKALYDLPIEANNTAEKCTCVQTPKGVVLHLRLLIATGLTRLQDWDRLSRDKALREEAHEADERVPTMLVTLAMPARCLRIRRHWSAFRKSGMHFSGSEARQAS